MGASTSIDLTGLAQPPGKRAPDTPRPGALSKLSHRGWAGYVEAAAATACCALLAWLFDPLLETPNLGLVFLTAVLVSAVRGGVGPALAASLVNFLVFNFFFTEPRYTFSVSAKPDVLTLGFFLLVAMVTGQLAARVHRQIETIRAGGRRIASLADFSRRLTGIVGRDDFARVVVDYLRSTLGLEAIVLFRDYSSKLVVAAGDTGGGLTAVEQRAAERAYEDRETTGIGGEMPTRGQWLFLPLTGREALGVLGVRASGRRLGLDVEQQRLLVAMRDQAGTALERVQLASAAEHTRLLTETDKLRTALLASVSHDLRTPLVSIKGATTALLELDMTLAPADKRELLENVLEETDRLNRYVQKLLDMTRLGYGAVNPRKDWRDVRETIGEARRALRRLLEHRAVKVSVKAGDEMIHTDAALLEQILVNLLENAAKYSPADTPIEIEGLRRGNAYELSVWDHGPGVPAKEREQVFDLFRRARAADQHTGGTGMGLAICRGFAEALGGRIEISARPQAPAACFTLLLPQPQRIACPPEGIE